LLLAEYMPFDLVIDEQTSWGEEARVSKTSVCGSWGAIAGELRYFADKFGRPRASIEGTQLPMDLVRRFATEDETTLAYDAERRKAPLVLTRRVEYFGFELDREVEAIDVFPEGKEDEARRVLAEALARGEARHFSVRDNLPHIDAVREAWRRSGGTLPRLNQAELAALYFEKLRGVHSLTEFKSADLGLSAELEALSPRAARAPYDALPNRTTVRDRDVEIDYDVEEVDGRPIGVARLRLPEKIARSLTEGEVPALDRPVRFVVPRGQRGSVRARTLDELQTQLDQPWTEEEIARFNRKRDEQRDAARTASRDRRDRIGREPKRGLRDRARSQRPGRSERDARREGPGEGQGDRSRGGKPGGGRGGKPGGRRGRGPGRSRH
jgi:hypothetical protein